MEMPKNLWTLEELKSVESIKIQIDITILFPKLITSIATKACGHTRPHTIDRTPNHPEVYHFLYQPL